MFTAGGIPNEVKGTTIRYTIDTDGGKAVRQYIVVPIQHMAFILEVRRIQQFNKIMLVG